MKQLHPLLEKVTRGGEELGEEAYYLSKLFAINVQLHYRGFAHCNLTNAFYLRATIMRAHAFRAISQELLFAHVSLIITSNQISQTLPHNRVHIFKCSKILLIRENDCEICALRTCVINKRSIAARRLKITVANF